MGHDATTALRLQRLIEANQALAQIESLSELLPQLLHFAQEVTEAEASSILLYKPETETLEFTLAYNEHAGTAESIIEQNIELRLGEGIAGHVAQQRESVIVEDARNDKRFFKQVDKVSGFETRTILCTPIIYQEELLGVVQVLNAKSKPSFDGQDLVILESFSHLAAVALVRSRMLEALLRQERMQAQLDAAARIQNNFLPTIPDIGPEHEIYAVTQPAIFVGGDFYDLMPMDDGSLLACVADVSGKGLPAALIGVTLWTRLRSLAPRFASPAQLLEALNHEVYDVLAQQMFATLVCCRYWPQSGETLVSVAGHIPPLCVTANDVHYLENLKGRPVGILPEGNYSEAAMRLGLGESLLLISDGITEARNEKGNFFGEERLHALLSSLDGQRGPQLVQHIENWRGNTAANDDLTVVEIHRK